MNDIRPVRALRGRRAIVPVLAFACAAFLGSAFGAQARLITFEEAVRIALEQNSTLRQAQTGAQLSEVAIEQARMRFVPDLRLNTQGAQSYGRNFSESEGRILEQSTQSLNLGVSSGITLFNGFGDVAALREARLAHEASEQDLRRAEETVIFTVASNYLALVQQQEQLRVQRERLAAESALEQQIQTYVNAGARTIADLYQQQASVANARLAVVEAERAVELAKSDLMQTLRLDPTGAYEFASPRPEELASGDETRGLDQLIPLALERRTDLEAEQTRVAAAEESIRVARAGRWPTISLNAGYNTAYTSASPFSFTDQLDQRRGGSVGIGISIPLFDRRTVAIASRRAELDAQNARIALESRQHEVGLQVRRAFVDLQAAREQSSAAEAQHRAAQQALEASEERYRVGAATLIELSQSRATQVQAASALVRARYNLQFQRMLIDYYIGNLDPSRYATP